MARDPKGEEKTPVPETLQDEGTPACGVMMPISATTSHGEAHWRDVQTLLHRAIIKADFKPVNVWENSSTDRISERIIANIFEHKIIVADISDMNPNVMLELGMRLSSKLPTIVVVNKGGTIPFDIRDFHAIEYPVDLNILEMEEFFEKLVKALKDKFRALQENRYTPFLSNVVVDVLSPEKRELPLDRLVLSRIDKLSEKLSRLESLSISSRLPSSSVRTSPSELTLTSVGNQGTKYFFTVPATAAAEAISNITDLNIFDSILIFYSDGIQSYVVAQTKTKFNESDTKLYRGNITSIVSKHGGYFGVPSDIEDKYL